MARLQQTLELEAQNYQEHQVSALIYSFINPNAQYRKEYLSFDTLERACQASHRKVTKKTKYLSDKAKKILAPASKSLINFSALNKLIIFFVFSGSIIAS